MKKILFVLILIIVLSLPGISADITACGEITENSVLTVDITDKSGECFDIKTSGIVFDCQGHTIDGNMEIDRDNYVDEYAYYMDYGIKLEGVSGVTVKNCVVKQFSKNIFLLNSDNNIVEDITTRAANSQSIALRTSSSNTIQRIDVPAGYGGIDVWEGSNGNSFSDITMDDVRYFSISDSDNNELTGITITNSVDGIELERSDNTIISDSTLNSNEDTGIYLDGDSDYTSITNVISNSNDDGIVILGDNNLLKDSTINSNTGYGVDIKGSNNELKNNDISDNMYSLGLVVLDFDLGLVYPSGTSSVIDKDNTVDGKNIWFLHGETGTTIDLDANNIGLFACIDCDNIIVENAASLTGNIYGILFYNTDNSVIRNVNVNNNMFGIYLHGSSNNRIENLKSEFNNPDFYYEDVGSAISIKASSNENTITDNLFILNNNGVRILDSTGNLIYNNNFTNNIKQQAVDSDSNNWDDGSRGNWWSDYFGSDTNGDNVGDTFVPHPGPGYDSFPLVTFELPECASSECCTNADCGNNEQCIDNVCVKKAECETDDDCDNGECKNGVCKKEKGSSDTSGSSGTTTESKQSIESKTFQSILSGEPIRMIITKDLSVLEMMIEVEEDSDIVELTIEEFPETIYDNKLDTVVYKYLKITSSEEISTADINFKVMNSWILDAGLTENHIALFHYDEGKRIELDTEFVSKDGVYSYFISTTDSFSLFEIGEKGEEKEIAVEIDETAFESLEEPDLSETVTIQPQDNTVVSVLIVVIALFLYIIYRLGKYYINMGKKTVKLIIKRKKK